MTTVQKVGSCKRCLMSILVRVPEAQRIKRAKNGGSAAMGFAQNSTSYHTSSGGVQMSPSNAFNVSKRKKQDSEIHNATSPYFHITPSAVDSCSTTLPLSPSNRRIHLALGHPQWQQLRRQCPVFFHLCMQGPHQHSGTSDIEPN
eukprot:GGOE01006323.1.p1 GENE.GGOE01006323.1~~GGOE01006323.1.p1  ORF type:complete len:145 (+),score=14.20 GGOE01006323.1:166-600(+)